MALRSRRRRPGNVRRRPVHYEEREQCILFQWATLQVGRWPDLEYLHASMAGVPLTQQQAVRARAAGMRAGVPDLLLPTPRGIYSGLWIELKREKGGRVSPAQRRWLVWLELRGYRAAVCHGWRSAAEEITRYMELEEGRDLA